LVDWEETMRRLSLEAKGKRGLNTVNAKRFASRVRLPISQKTSEAKKAKKLITLHPLGMASLH
jgi:hypothetical protein